MYFAAIQFLPFLMLAISDTAAYGSTHDDSSPSGQNSLLSGGAVGQVWRVEHHTRGKPQLVSGAAASLHSTKSLARRAPWRGRPVESRALDTFEACNRQDTQTVNWLVERQAHPADDSQPGDYEVVMRALDRRLEYLRKLQTKEVNVAAMYATTSGLQDRLDKARLRLRLISTSLRNSTLVPPLDDGR